AEDGIRDRTVTGVQTCALPIWASLLAIGTLPFSDDRRQTIAKSRYLSSVVRRPSSVVRWARAEAHGRPGGVNGDQRHALPAGGRSEERRVGKECRSRWGSCREK